jgi:hypothetical protein
MEPFNQGDICAHHTICLGAQWAAWIGEAIDHIDNDQCRSFTEALRIALQIAWEGALGLCHVRFRREI